MAQLRDIERIAARFYLVGGAPEQLAGDAVVQGAQRIVERAFHLIEHHALVAERVAVEHVAPAFLQEVQVVQLREKGGVQVHVEQVEKSLREVLANG